MTSADVAETLGCSRDTARRKLAARREALRAAVAYLHEHGTATPADFRSDVYPEHSGGYTTGKAPARSWWKNALYPALRDLTDATGVIGRADTTGIDLDRR